MLIHIESQHPEQLNQSDSVNGADAIVDARNEAQAHLLTTETPLETAERLREEYGIVLTEKVRRTLPRRIYNTF
jgi:antitoxin VapB